MVGSLIQFGQCHVLIKLLSSRCQHKREHTQKKTPPVSLILQALLCIGKIEHTFIRPILSIIMIIITFSAEVEIYVERGQKPKLLTVSCEKFVSKNELLVQQKSILK